MRKLKPLLRKHWNCILWFVVGILVMVYGEVSTLQYFLCWSVLITYLWRKPVKEGDIVIEKNEESLRTGNETECEKPKAILVMEMPKNCDDCYLCVEYGGCYKCVATGDVMARPHEIRPAWCPLRELPERPGAGLEVKSGGEGEKWTRSQVK